MDCGNSLQHKRYQQYLWKYYQVHQNNYVETGLSAVLLLNYVSMVGVAVTGKFI